MELLNSVIGSPITNVVLTLLIVFQAFWQWAKDQNTKNNLFSIRRSLLREIESKNSLSSERAKDLVDFLDSTLATLGARVPFTDRVGKVIQKIRDRIFCESNSEIEILEKELKKNSRKDNYKR